jgi:chromosome segregation protein
MYQIQRDVQREEISLEHINQRYLEAQLRYEKNQMGLAEPRPDHLQNELLTLKTQNTQLEKQHQIAIENHRLITHKSIELREQLSSIEQQIHQAQDKLQTLTMEHAKLFSIQNAALRHQSKENSDITKWEKFPRLAEVLKVNGPWLNACEKVLGDSIQAIVLESMEQLWPELPHLKGHASLFITPDPKPHTISAHPCLSDQVLGQIPCSSHQLKHTFTASSLEEALSWLPTLKDYESIITADGYWLGPGWVKINGREPQDDTSLLYRQQTLTQLEANLLTAREQLKNLQEHRDNTHTSVVSSERESDALKQQLLVSQDALNTNTTQINHKQQEMNLAITKIKVLTEESEALQLKIEELLSQKMATEEQLRQTQAAASQQAQILKQLTLTKTSWEDNYNQLRDQVDKARNTLHQTELQCQQETLKAQQLRDKITHAHRQLESLHARLKTLEQHYNELTNPDLLQHTLLEEKLQLHHQTNDALILQRQREEALLRELNEGESYRHQQEQHLHSMQEKIQQEQLREQALLVRTEHLTESLASLEANIEAVLAELSTEDSLEEREQQLIALNEKIERLGAINLIAIEEYQTEIARKQHLDEQHQDLISALNTLEAAIAKMDKETQLRLKDTFDQVNASFQSLFPRLFDGGCARLELTCDNLLEAGVLVMAQPPGKRNGTIHLLSGGEKAMTAVALVFAIFQQNPSPFCMLDEVDAPLDDANVKRFCSLVKEMSKFVQFLFITHNKVTMELAEHLIGVTMREPGVSRLVAVDVKEALAIIE